MPPSFGMSALTPNDRKTLMLLWDGRTAAAARAQPDATDSAPEAATVSLSERVRAGNALLDELGLGVAEGGDSTKREGMIVLRSPTASRVTLVFNGNTATFSLPFPLVNEFDTHVVLVRDPSRCFGFAGIPGLGADYEECLVNLRRIIGALGTSEVYCLGMSSGGSTVLKVGCDLQVNGILGFSVPTTLDLNDDPGSELKHYPQLTRLYGRRRDLGIDLAKYYASKMPRPSLILIFSATHVRDSWLAERMTGIAGVELVATDGFEGHATYRWMNDNGKLNDLFTRMYELKPLTGAASVATVSAARRTASATS